MPELPEVETVRRSLHPRLKGCTLSHIEIRNANVISMDSGADPAGLILQGVRRRGKYLLIDWDRDQTLLVHLRMTGRLLVQAYGEPSPKHTHLCWHLENPCGSMLRLDFQDTRRFGHAWSLPRNTDGLPLNGPSGFYRLGPEPLGIHFTLQHLADSLAGRKRTLKALLLDQTIVAGLGNIYVDEALFAAGLDPRTPGSRLGSVQIAALREAIVTILRQAIARQGTTLRDYVDGLSRRGQFQQNLMVYGRHRESCRMCGTSLQQSKVCGRTTVHCPSCQILP